RRAWRGYDFSTVNDRRVGPPGFFWTSIMARMWKRVRIWKCERCGWEWASRTGEEPKRCAGCKRTYWKTPRIRPAQADYRTMKYRKPRAKPAKTDAND